MGRFHAVNLIEFRGPDHLIGLSVPTPRPRTSAAHGDAQQVLCLLLGNVSCLLHGNVEHDPDAANGATGRGGAFKFCTAADLDPPHLTVGPNDSVLKLKISGALGAQRLSRFMERDIAVFRVN